MYCWQLLPKRSLNNRSSNTYSVLKYFNLSPLKRRKWHDTSDVTNERENVPNGRIKWQSVNYCIIPTLLTVHVTDYKLVVLMLYC